MKMERRVPDVSIAYHNLSMSVKLPKNVAEQSMTTVPRVLLGAAAAIPRALYGAALRVAGKSPLVETEEFKILDDISGVLRPGQLTLLLGHPGCGKSTFLKALTTRLSNQRDLRGEVRYGGLSVPEVKAAGIHLGQLVQYVNQLDEHFPFLTVRETLTFVAENSLAGADSEAAKARVQDVLDLLHLNGGCSRMHHAQVSTEVRSPLFRLRLCQYDDRQRVASRRVWRREKARHCR